MLSRIKNTLGSPDNSDLATYKALRAASKSWADKLNHHPAADRFDLFKAARKVGISVQDRTFVFDDECEMAVMMDYYLLNYRPREKTLAETVSFAPGELAPLEAAFHEACLASRTSLYLITAVQDAHPRIQLRDRLQPDRPELWLTDIALADSFRRIGGQALLFTRVVAAQGLHFTGGFSFVFEPKHEATLLDAYRRALWQVAAHRRDEHRTGFFLGMNRRYGHQQDFADVEPPADRGPA